jgi:hypothetical protein
MNREIKAEIKRAAKHILDNYDTIIDPKIPDIVKEIKEIIELCKSGKYTEEELLDIVREKADKLTKSEVTNDNYN